MPIKVHFLGTASGKPSKHRNVTGIAIIMEEGNFSLIDCGEATQHQIMKSEEVKLSKLDSIFITHLHGDHIFGLHGLLCTLNEIRTKPLYIFGPFGIKSYLSFIIPNISNYKLNIYEFPEKKNSKMINIYWREFNNYIYDFGATLVPHCNSLYCYAYKITQRRKKCKIDMKKLAPVIDNYREQICDLGFNPAESIIEYLKLGTGINLYDNFGKLEYTLNKADYCISEDVYSIAIVLDNNNSSHIPNIFGECNTLIHESTYAITNSMSETEMKEIVALAYRHGHSTNINAFNTAKDMNCSKLILTHFSNRYNCEEETTNAIIDGCNRDSSINRNIEIYCAKDFDTIVVCK